MIRRIVAWLGVVALTFACVVLPQPADENPASTVDSPQTGQKSIDEAHPQIWAPPRKVSKSLFTLLNQVGLTHLYKRMPENRGVRGRSLRTPLFSGYFYRVA